MSLFARNMHAPFLFFVRSMSFLRGDLLLDLVWIWRIAIARCYMHCVPCRCSNSNSSSTSNTPSNASTYLW
ncbi:hypothetical protein BC832DRAFT_565349 [Gaertneriomyces semiglobifer]|nr:hypothetical protein BC832DRAFT_565349 [Gaertneriomyces semiglobifer]